MKFKRYLALEASAGSGKTFALSVRYIALLLQGFNPASILALTFTKKTANEMKSRVFNTLQNLEDENYKNELNEICVILEANKDEVLQKRDDILDSFLNANVKISTIDAFLSQILRKFSLHFGLMPNFISSDEIAKMKLERRFIKNSQAKDMYESLVYFASTTSKNFFEYFINLYEKDSELENFKFDRTFFPDESKVLKIVGNIKEYLVANSASDQAIKQFNVESVGEVVSKGFFTKESLNYRTFSKCYTPKLDEMFFELKEEICKFYIQKEKFLLGELFFLYEIYKNSRFDEAKNSRELSFLDATNIVYKLLNGHIDNDFLYFRLDANVEHLLIDEFQDTSIVQYKILKPIMEEITSGIGTKNRRSLFYVGDKKQSIYRFRGGVKALFDYVAKSLRVEVDSLSNNYRSRFEVVQFVNNTFFGRIKDYKNQNPLKEGGFVEVFTCENLLEDINKTVDMLLKSGKKEEDIAILCLKNDDAAKIKESLEEHIKDLKVNTESNLRLIESENVKKIVEFLKYLYFDKELYGRNFQVLMGESFESLPETLDFDKNDEPLICINKCIKKYKINAYDVDVFRFLEIAANYKDLESLIFSLERGFGDSIKKNIEGIKIFTVHKSKGLEFDTVLVVDRLGKKNNRPSYFLFDYDEIKLKNIYIHFSKREFVDEEYKCAREKEQILRDEDALNTQYVAFTRAKNNLFIFQKEQNSYFENLLLENGKFGSLYTEESLQLDKKEEKLEFKYKRFGKQEVVKQESLVEGDFANIYFGLALHFTLEMLSEFNEFELKNALIFTKSRYSKILKSDAFESINKRVENLLKDGTFNEILQNGKIFKEQPFVFGKKRGQVDLLVEKEDKIYIIDYKTSPYTKDAHIKQIKEYKEAFSSFYNKEVKALLFYLHEDSVEKFEF